MKKLLVCLLVGALLKSIALTAEAAKQIAFGKGKSSGQRCSLFQCTTTR